MPWSNEESLKVFKRNILFKSHKYFRNYQSPLPLPLGHEHVVEGAESFKGAGFDQRIKAAMEKALSNF